MEILILPEFPTSNDTDQVLKILHTDLFLIYSSYVSAPVMVKANLKIYTSSFRAKTLTFIKSKKMFYHINYYKHFFVHDILF